MKRNFVKVLLIAMGIIPFLWVFIISFKVYTDNIGNYLMEVLLNVLQYPFVLLGLVPISIGILMPLKKEQKNIEINPNGKKNIWRFVFVVGMSAFVIPLLHSIFCFFYGFTFLFSTSTGFDGMIESLVIWSFLFWPTYVVGVVLIFLSVKKLKTTKK